MAEEVIINEDDRIIKFSGGVDLVNCGKITSYLLEVEVLDNKKEKKEKDYTRKPVRLWINSHGGSVYGMWEVVDTIHSMRTPVYTFCSGSALSAAFIMFLAGEKRYASRHVTFMQHQVSWSADGDYENIRRSAEILKNDVEMSENYIVERTKITHKELEDARNAREDWYMYYDEALRREVITGSIDDALKDGEL